MAVTLGLALLVPVLSKAADAEKKAAKKGKMTEEQQQTRKDLLEKYDANKDGKIDKDERAKMSDDDKAKAATVGLGAAARKKKAE